MLGFDFEKELSLRYGGTISAAPANRERAPLLV